MIKYLTLEQILRLHDAALEKFGGLKGVRDSNLLLSSIEHPKAAMFGEDLYPTITNKAAAYLFISCATIPLMMETKEQDAVLPIYFSKSTR